MIINHNIAALNTYRQLSSNQALGSKSLEKLSAGLRINRAGDDAAGLAISEKMRGQIRGLTQASRNAQDGISLIQTAEGALNETHSILQRMRELAVQASNDTNTDEDRVEIQKELNQLTSEINRIGNTTEFNTKKIINGEMGINGGGGTTPGANALWEIDLSGVLLDSDSSFKLTIYGETYEIQIEKEESPNNAKVTVTKDDGNEDVGGAEVDGTTNENLAQAIAAAFEGETIAGYNIKVDEDKLCIEATKEGEGEEDNCALSDQVGVTLEVDFTKGSESEEENGTGTDGSAKIQVGANQGQQFTVSINDMRTKALGVSGTTAGEQIDVGEGEYAYFAAVTSGEESNALTDKSDTADEYALDITDADKATNAVTVIQKAIQTVSAERSKLGAYQNRLEHTINNLGTSAENLTAAESRVRDVDMANEMMEFTKMSILQQAATAMLAQANQQPQQVLQLLR